MSYNQINNLFGWLCFASALLVYVLTLEPSASFWDSGEFIAAAYKLQIVHQPGAPLYLMLGKVFSLFAMGNTQQVAYWINLSSAVASAMAIMFLFWTITALSSRVQNRAEQATGWNLFTVICAGLTGAFAFTFSDSFWFSAVESEVYALSSLCTAVVFWAMLKWDRIADQPGADRWLVFIAYVMGLSIGVHLLNLLTIPALALLYYFRRAAKINFKGILWSILAGVIILAFIQYGIIQYTVKFAAWSDLFFVNDLGFGFGSGVMFFSMLLIVSMVAGILFTLNGNKYYLWTACFSFISLMSLGGGIIGFLISGLILVALEYLIKIRQKMYVLNLALVSLVFIFLGFGSFAMIVIRASANPTLNNYQAENAFSLSGYVNREQYVQHPLFYGPYFDSKSVDIKYGDKIYRKGKEKYEEAGRDYKRVYDRNTLMPRISSDDPKHGVLYRQWLGLSEGQSPTFLDNVEFMFGHQVGFMYARYFAWNFIGRQNDEQGNGDTINGNWLSGIGFIDNLLLGGQSALPESQTENKSYNKFFFLPFLLGMIGLIWHYRKNPNHMASVALLFFFTGLAIIIYLNQTPGEPRERDYAYTGSFYAFAIWVGLGVAGLAEFFKKYVNMKPAVVMAAGIGLLAAPVIMAKGGWDDHDRSDRITARDMAYNYLDSCAPNAILFTYGDNDTYPIWYAQEVENYRTDVRVVNLSLLNADWYINQMKFKVNQAEALPLTMPNEKYKKGTRDVLGYQDYGIPDAIEIKDVFGVMISDNDADKVAYQDGSKENFLPTKNFKLSIDPEQLISSGTLPRTMKDSITKQMEWTYNKNYVSKGDLALIDILAHNNWERPVYFSISMPTENYMGLDNYLYQEGFAFRLLPLKYQSISADQPQPDLVNSEVMYVNMMEKFRWAGMKTLSYMDPETRRMNLSIINQFNSLAQSLYDQGKEEKARKALLKCIEVVPDINYSLNFTLRKLYMADLLYKVNETEKANALVTNTSNYIEDELIYYAALNRDEGGVNMRDVQLGAYVSAELVKLTALNQQNDLSSKIQNQYDRIVREFE